jgi:hypothetical protein
VAVYVDDTSIPAQVGPHDSRWSHLIADSVEELHDFAAKLGLRRSYFQEGKPRGDGSRNPHWHYDVTEGKRQRAIQLGAQPVTWRDSVRIIHEREARNAQRDAGATAAGRGSDRASRLDYDAGVAMRAGDLDRAVRLIYQARQLDPSRSELWDERQRRLRQSMAATTERRLKDCGIKPDDPGLQAIRGWNAAAGVSAALAGPHGERDRPGRTVPGHAETEPLPRAQGVRVKEEPQMSIWDRTSRLEAAEADMDRTSEELADAWEANGGTKAERMARIGEASHNHGAAQAAWGHEVHDREAGA